MKTIDKATSDFYENAFEHYELKVLRFTGCTEQWLDFVVLSRDQRSPITAHSFLFMEGVKPAFPSTLGRTFFKMLHE